MSHTTGKIEVIGHSGPFLYLRYHQAVRAQDVNRVLVVRSNPNARWLDDYTELRPAPPDATPRDAHRRLAPA
jgi:hypothetical protein